jgi:chitinase
MASDYRTLISCSKYRPFLAWLQENYDFIAGLRR